MALPIARTEGRASRIWLYFALEFRAGQAEKPVGIGVLLKPIRSCRGPDGSLKEWNLDHGGELRKARSHDSGELTQTERMPDRKHESGVRHWKYGSLRVVREEIDSAGSLSQAGISFAHSCDNPEFYSFVGKRDSTREFQLETGNFAVGICFGDIPSPECYGNRSASSDSVE